MSSDSMYRRPFVIEHFMSNRKGKLALRFLTFLLSDIMEHNANSYGASAEYHHKHNVAWVLTEYDITIHQLPNRDETVYAGTLPYSFKRMFGYRIYDMISETGDVYLEGKGKFVLIDFKTKKITEPTEDMLSKFTDAIKKPKALSFEKLIPTRDTLLYKAKTSILDHHIDVNNHVNNAFYAALALDYLKPEFINEDDIKRLKVYYKKEAVYGDDIDLYYYQEPNGIYIEMKTKDTVNAQIFLIKNQA